MTAWGRAVSGGFPGSSGVEERGSLAVAVALGLEGQSGVALCSFCAGSGRLSNITSIGAICLEVSVAT